MICPSCGAHNSDSAAFCTLCLARFSEPERANPSAPVPQPVRAASVNEWTGKKCAYCMTDLTANDDVLLCGACGMPHHQDCWSENSGCAAFGCLAADNGSAMVSASPRSGRSGVDGVTMLIATFGPSTGWLGRTITFDGEMFTLQDHGPISVVDVLNYGRQGQLVWVNDGMRAWVESKASVPQAANVASSLASGWAKLTASAGVATVAVGKAAEATKASFTEGRSAAKTKADNAFGSPKESTLAVEPTLEAEPMPVVRESAPPAATSVDVPLVSIADEMARLAELHAKGILTDAEFAACKAKVIG